MKDSPPTRPRARLLVPLLAGVALFFTFRGGSTLVTLLFMAYSMVTTLFPGWSHSVTDINAGFLALVLNVVAMVLVSCLSSPRGIHRSV